MDHFYGRPDCTEKEIGMSLEKFQLAVDAFPSVIVICETILAGSSHFQSDAII